ncbi:MAG: hypothetical protein QW328_02405 [Nitrososphaerota archaeon]
MSTNLRTFLIRRLILVIPTLLGISLLIFGVTQLFDPIERASLYIRDPRQIRFVEEIIKNMD